MTFVEKAYEVAKSAHEGQFRSAGEPYILHPVQVAGILAELQMERGRIVAFLLLLVIFGETIGTTTNPILKDVKLGLDLQGGFEVLYEVSKLKEGQQITEAVGWFWFFHYRIA